MATKTCFVIAPIGDAGSDTRRRSDWVVDRIITPAVRRRGYAAIRADRMHRPGVITVQVIRHVMDDPLVVADLTDGNPNVFYELALRHAVQKPLVQLIEKGQRIPFDIHPMRTITVDHGNPRSIREAKKEILKHIDAFQESGDVVTPISLALNRTLGDLILQGWRGRRGLDVLVPHSALGAVLVGQNLASRLGLTQGERTAFAAELRILLKRGIDVTLIIMPPAVLKTVHLEAAEDQASFTLPALEALATKLGRLAKRVHVVFHPAATLSLLAVDRTYGFVEPKFQKTAKMSSRLTVMLGPELFDADSLERMLYDGLSGRGGALRLDLNQAVVELRRQLVASAMLNGRPNTALRPTSRGRPVPNKPAKSAGGGGPSR